MIDLPNIHIDAIHRVVDDGLHNAFYTAPLPPPGRPSWSKHRPKAGAPPDQRLDRPLKDTNAA